MTVCVSGNDQNQVEMKGYQVLPLSRNAFCIVVCTYCKLMQRNLVPAIRHNMFDNDCIPRLMIVHCLTGL